MGNHYQAALPGTLDENGIGMKDTAGAAWHPDAMSNQTLQAAENCIATRLTRKHTYTGPAAFSRIMEWQVPAGKRVFIECERSRKLSLRVNGREAEVFCPGTVSTPYVFEVTDLVTGHDRLEFICDNSYPGWPKDSIICSSAATDETQTNWNGLLGYFSLRTENACFISGLRVYPVNGLLNVKAEVCADHAWESTMTLRSDVLRREECALVRGEAGTCEISFNSLELRADVANWDEDDGQLYTLTAEFAEERKTVRFGLREFTARDGHLILNGRPVFLRSEANCAVFPETGHPPMDTEIWRKILLQYRSYGVNCMRFHSHCPPEAAFTAADELGMLMQPELSHWNPKTAFSTEESRSYYRTELKQILKMLANHPSFVMLTLGNELHADPDGHTFMSVLLDEARALDPTRLYANGSNVHYGMMGCDPHSDFYTSCNYYEYPLRAANSGMKGWLNRQYPDTAVNYDRTVDEIRKITSQPVISFEVGQYEVLPDFDELSDFAGVTVPDNLNRIRNEADRKGVLARWKERVDASGELALLCYRAEVEAALATKGMSGISLLGLQDFPGQGTALVGMMNSHLCPKPFPFAKPERFAEFFRGVLPLILTGKRTYRNTEILQIPLQMVNYGKTDLYGTAEWSLTGDGTSLHGSAEPVSAPCGLLTDLGIIKAALNSVVHPCRLDLRVRFAGHENNSSIWVFPDECPDRPAEVYECRALDEGAQSVLDEGGIVYLAPDSTAESLPDSIQSQFSTDFWSVGTFPEQEGGMGQLIACGHPLFRDFPTENHTDWQWWPMAGSRAVILPERYETIIEVMDSYAYLRPMAQILECRCKKGRLLFSTLGLHQMMEYPEAQALQNAIYRYLGSDDFAPRQQIDASVFERLVVTAETMEKDIS